jgi:hypothetical protein
MREKLIKLLNKATHIANSFCFDNECDTCEHSKNSFCLSTIEADYLIENGVTIKENGWVPTSLEFYPEKGGDYLCLCCIDGHTEFPFYMVLRYYLVDKNPHFQHESEHGLKVTHWMCLPDMPKGGDSE